MAATSAGLGGDVGADVEPPRRRPWIAALLTLLAPGLGHLYAGWWRTALVVLPSAVVAQLLVTALFRIRFSRPVFLVLVASIPALLVGLVIHAAWCARTRAEAIPRRRGLRVASYAAFVLAAAALSEVASTGPVRTARAFRIPSGAMLPTLEIGDHAYTDLRAFESRSPRRGEVVVFSAARDSGTIAPLDVEPTWQRESFATRVIGLPGDRISFENGDLWLDGRPIPVRAVGERTSADGAALVLYEEALPGHTHRIARRPDRPGPTIPEVVVPEGRYLLLGDNRDDSNDGRYWGTVRGDDLIGPLVRIYGSWMRSGLAFDVRWERFGLEVE